MSFRSFEDSAQDVPTEDILEHFGSDPTPVRRRQQLKYKNGECFVPVETIVDNYPKQRSFHHYCNAGPLLHEAEAANSAVLSFDAYAEEDGLDEEIHRIRIFKINYHLNDDTITVNEPFVDNTGYLHGRIFRRQKVPAHNRIGKPYVHWSDLNVGTDINLFQTIYRITSCDTFTRSFLEEHGTKVNEDEELPEDPWLVRRRGAPRTAPKLPDQREFINRPPMLVYRCCWLDHMNDFHGCRMKRIFKMYVYCSDHTVALIEETKEFEGQLFLKRIALPFPVQPDMVKRDYRWWDIRPGVWVDVFCRPMFVFECANDETKSFTRQQFGETDFANYSSQILEEGPPTTQFFNSPSILKFRCTMVDAPSVLYGLHFLLYYDVNRRIVNINEEGRKTWTDGRVFLKDVDASTFSENQFAPGRILQFFKWRFNLVQSSGETGKYLRWKQTPIHK
ncbi:DM10 domain-containing protein [Caenorhabditis elegans]|uniref:DM10 domain-containing protein n=1 Tax=Caenorhabditis elegans TaxID=6239 RepID=Q9XWW8_CAEEL|nr:DM10 domain-containing protein [Caenorhabditis elegans]CAA21520.2 DM10 domain-containing protein [Caenorhabditis elegans]|eukprot:NP_509738.2 EF-Hand domain-Containing protein 1 homolog [Caenorhabditis elegans]